MSGEALGNAIAPLNALLNFTSACFLLAGYYFIKKGERDRHRFSMKGAVTASALFLVFYVIRFALTGTHRFAGEGVARTVYLSILFSHMVLAAIAAPLVIRTFLLAMSGRFELHRRWARWTYPIWLYVSITGLIVYAMLYHLYGYLES